MHRTVIKKVALLKRFLSITIFNCDFELYNNSEIINVIIDKKANKKLIRSRFIGILIAIQYIHTIYEQFNFLDLKTIFIIFIQ